MIQEEGDSSDRSLGDGLEEKLFGSFSDDGWHVERNVRIASLELDGVISRERSRYAVELKVAAQSRVPLLEGLLSAAILQSRRVAPEVHASPLAIVGAPIISDKVLRNLERFVASYGGGVPWGVIDGRGRLFLQGPGLEGLQRHPVRKSRENSRFASSSFGLFSDRSQWMLKLLVSHRLPPDLRLLDSEGRRMDLPLPSAAALARHAGVSAPSAARLVAALREEGFCERGGPVQPLRMQELLERWRSAVLQERVREVRAKWLFPAGPGRLEKAIQGRSRELRNRACLGLFAAARRLGFDHVSGVSPHVYVEKPSVLRDVGLIPAEPGEAVDVFVRVPRYPEAIFRAASRADGVPATDVVQCWLDASGHPSRGRELADDLYGKVIGPALIGSD